MLLIPSIGAGQLDRGRPAGSVPGEYTGGLAPEGAVAVEEFVRAGGTLVTLGSSCQWAIDLLELPVVDVTREPAGQGFNCPGSVLRTIPNAESAINAGLDASIPVFFTSAGAFREMTSDERKNASGTGAVDVLLRYAPSRLLLSGWISKPEVIEDQGAWVRVRHGRGRVHLFGFQPQYRGWARGTFQLVYRAAILDSAR